MAPPRSPSSADHAAHAHHPRTRRSRAVRRPAHDDTPCTEPPAHHPEPGPVKSGDTAGTTLAGTLNPPLTAPMTTDQRARAIDAWAALIATWWVDHPPDAPSESPTKFATPDRRPAHASSPARHQSQQPPPHRDDDPSSRS